MATTPLLQMRGIQKRFPGVVALSGVSLTLNRGEVRGALGGPDGARPGWDIGGVVEQAAADGSGPKVGTRVVGILGRGAWAQRVAVPGNQLGVLPDNVSFEQASTLPVAGHFLPREAPEAVAGALLELRQLGF